MKKWDVTIQTNDSEDFIYLTVHANNVQVVNTTTYITDGIKTQLIGCIIYSVTEMIG